MLQGAERTVIYTRLLRRVAAKRGGASAGEEL
jgi:hypothetical protein